MTSLLRAKVPIFFPLRKEVWVPNWVIKEVLTMQFLRRTSLHVRKLLGVISSLPAKFMDEGVGAGIRKESQKICHFDRFFFQLTNDSVVVTYSSLFASSVRAGRALGSLRFTHCFVSSVYGFGAYFLPLLELIGVGKVRTRLSIMTFVTPTSRSIGQTN